jgi:hypothetical protein
VRKDGACPSPPPCPHKKVSYLLPHSPRRRALDEVDEDDDDDDDDDDDEEEDSEEEDEEDEDGEPSSVPGQPELSRAERRELKKKQAAEQSVKAEGDGEDDLAANPNRLTKKLNISDLAAPRELTRRERCLPSLVNNSHTYIFVLGSRRKSKKLRTVIGR